MSKAIYQPKGKAGEYAKYAVNFYVGCSNDCDYCYCKRGMLGHAMGKPTPTLKKCFKDENDALAVFRKELDANILELRKHGLFFTFTSDPWLPADKAPGKLADVKTAVQMQEMQMKLDTALQGGKIAQAFYEQKNAQLHAHGKAIGCTYTDGDGWVDNADLFGE